MSDGGIDDNRVRYLAQGYKQSSSELQMAQAVKLVHVRTRLRSLYGIAHTDVPDLETAARIVREQKRKGRAT